MQELESEFDQEDQISVDYWEEEKEDEVDDQMDNVTVFWGKSGKRKFWMNNKSSPAMRPGS